MPKNKSAEVDGKKFTCTYDNCNRTFTRQEHLRRHSQNHEAGDYTCDRCRAHFKRRDLLDRHLTRHRQKDANCDSLMTRKRSWKDADGNIVAKKPILVGQVDKNSRDVRDGSAPQPLLPQTFQAASPEPTATSPGPVEPWMSVPREMDLNTTLVNQCNVESSFWEASKAVDDYAPTSDPFNPDTASSFNMPFTTMNNYNWLFDTQLGACGDDALNSIDLSFMDNAFTEAIEVPSTQHGPGEYFGPLHSGNGNKPYASVAKSGETVQSYRASHQHSPSTNVPVYLHTPVSDVIPARSPSNKPSSSSSERQTPSSHASISTKAISFSSIQSFHSGKDMFPRHTAIPTAFDSAMGFSIPNSNFPRLDALGHSQVLHCIESMNVTMPDGSRVTSDHPLLSLSALQKYCDLYFSRFNTAYPLIHQMTFAPSKVETLLLLSVLLLGATYGEKDEHQLAVCIHDVMRPRIFTNAAFSAQPQLWILQTILLVECFGKSRAGHKQHDMSHLFHGLLINLIRRSDCQTIEPESLGEDQGDLEDEWKAWIEAEQKKRLALLCFMWDTQHAVLFCQSLCMSAFELRSTLPCDQPLWEASSAEQWQKLRRKHKAPPRLLPILKLYLNDQIPGGADDLNALSRTILLHGLMSIAWDMNRRDQTSLGLLGNDLIGDWRLRISRAYDTWKADFDAYVISTTRSFASGAAAVQRREMYSDFVIYSTVNSALYHAAQVILFSSFLDTQIYAGARHILGRPVARADYSRSQRIVKRWANEQTMLSSRAAWHAAHILKNASTDLENFDAGGLFIHPWCLYLATVTIWSFYRSRPSPQRNTLPSQYETYEDDDEMIWDTAADMNILVNYMASATPELLLACTASDRKRKTASLAAVVVRHLGKIRWAVVHDGMLVLKGLVPWRLINEGEVH